MKFYKEYYKLGLDQYLQWKYSQKDEWWRKKEFYGHLDYKGDYIETVRLISKEEKNDGSLFVNGTNVKNSKWDILFSMLGQALVDWCVENVEYKKLWAINFRIDRTVDENGQNVYDHSVSVKEYIPGNDWQRIENVKDEDELQKFDGCGEFLCDLVARFIESQGTDIPNDWNYFSFGLDSLSDSCKRGVWVCTSDGYMNLGHNDEKTKEYEEFVECM